MKAIKLIVVCLIVVLCFIPILPITPNSYSLQIQVSVQIENLREGANIPGSIFIQQISLEPKSTVSFYDWANDKVSQSNLNWNYVKRYAPFGNPIGMNGTYFVNCSLISNGIADYQVQSQTFSPNDLWTYFANVTLILPRVNSGTYMIVVRAFVMNQTFPARQMMNWSATVVLPPTLES